MASGLGSFLGLAEVYIGTSGWDYDDWVGPFYESEARMFSQYCEVFNTVEINSTFYSMPNPAFMRRLARAAPRGFVFSAKLYKGITHRKRLNPKLGVESDLKEYLRAMEPLRSAGKLGAILVQMPPKPRAEFPYFEEFLSMLPKGFRFAVEFRHESWLKREVLKLLEDHGVAYTVVDEPLLPPEVHVTADFAYVRWHGRGQRPWYYYLYRESELREWVPKVMKLMEEVKVIYGYFNNHFRGYAPRNALQMLSLLGLATRRQREVLRRIEEYFKRGEVEAARLAAMRALAKGEVEEVIRALAGDRRFKRALEMPDAEVKVLEINGRIIARVKNYRVVIDLEDRTLAHDCEDWKKRVEGKRICKHVAKLLLVLPGDLRRRVVEDLIENLDDWSFEVL